MGFKGVFNTCSHAHVFLIVILVIKLIHVHCTNKQSIQLNIGHFIKSLDQDSDKFQKTKTD